MEQPSQRVVATAATPAGFRVPLNFVREYARKSFWMACEWLLAPAPRVAGLTAYTSFQKHARVWYRASRAWLWAPVTWIHANRPR